MTNQSTTRRGVTSLEVVMAVSIAGVIIAYAGNVIAQFVSSARDVTSQTQALYLAEEGLELIRFIRDEDWSDITSLPLATTRYLNITATDIEPSTSPEIIGDFTRSFQVTNVYRNSSTDDIVASTTGGSVADPDSKYVTVSVSWDTPTTTVSLTSILTNISP